MLRVEELERGSPTRPAEDSVRLDCVATFEIYEVGE